MLIRNCIPGCIIDGSNAEATSFLVSLLCLYTTTAGHLNVGDQLLVCDGISLLDVTHDEAAQALKRAMDMESVC